MGFALDEVVPWGRSFEEYVAMFDLSQADLARRILGCSDGPAAFNAELTRRGGSVVSVDPLYAFDSDAIRGRIAATYEKVLEQARRNAADFVWRGIGSVEELGRIRMAAMTTFLGDLPVGAQEGRYVAAALPRLPFTGDEFGLALSSHFLFTYSEHLTLEFHLESLLELLRIAREVRVFPTISLDAMPSPYLDEVVRELERRHFAVALQRVPYEFQRGGNEMLRVTHAEGR